MARNKWKSNDVLLGSTRFPKNESMYLLHVYPRSETNRGVLYNCVPEMFIYMFITSNNIFHLQVNGLGYVRLQAVEHLGG